MNNFWRVMDTIMYILAFFCGVMSFVTIFILNDMNNGLRFTAAFSACTFAVISGDRYDNA